MIERGKRGFNMNAKLSSSESLQFIYDPFNVITFITRFRLSENFILFTETFAHVSIELVAVDQYKT